MAIALQYNKSYQCTLFGWRTPAVFEAVGLRILKQKLKVASLKFAVPDVLSQIDSIYVASRLHTRTVRK